MSEDEAKLAAALTALARDGRIEFWGEFGNEIATFLPFAAWLKREGRLQGRKVVTYQGMRPYYFFLSDDEIEQRDGPRAWLPPAERRWPGSHSATAVKAAWHVYPKFREHFAGAAPDRPVLFIQNKFTVEWATGPINYIGLATLKRLFEDAQGRFDVIYSRPGIAVAAPGYVNDGNGHCDYPDRAMAERFAHVRIFEDMAQGEDYNRLKLETLAATRMFVAVQGGGAHLLAAFGGSLLLLLHRAGEEYPHAYAAGPYKYLADPPPLLLVARDFAQFHEAVGVFEHVRVEGGRLIVGKAARPLIDRLRM